jgi:large subunit ribosomal protein L10
MAITRQKKEEILQGLVDKFGRSHSVVFADYRGLDVASISELRRELRKGDAEMKVAKKTLIGLAAKDTVGELDSSVMEGPVLATFSYEDPLSGIQILYKFSKKNENIKLLGGIVDGKMVGPEVIQKYAKLPSKEELLAKFIGSINSPLSGFVGIGNSLVSGIVRALSAYKDSKPAEAAPAEPTPAPVVEEKVEEKVDEKTEETPGEETPAEPSEEEKPSDEPEAEAPAEPEPEEKKEGEESA